MAHLNSFEIYRPYMLTEKRFCAENTRKLASEVHYPPVESYLGRVAEYAVTRRWGRRVSWDPSLLDAGRWSGSTSRPTTEHEEEDGRAK
jgi:hypothetical protein